HLVAVDGEVRQLVEVKLNVVQPDRPRNIDATCDHMALEYKDNSCDVRIDSPAVASAGPKSRASASNCWRRGRGLPRAGGQSCWGTLLSPPSPTQSRSPPRHFRPPSLPLSHFLFFSNFKLTNAP